MNTPKREGPGSGAWKEGKVMNWKGSFLRVGESQGSLATGSRGKGGELERSKEF